MQRRPAFSAFGGIAATNGHGQSVPLSAAERRILAALVIAFPRPVPEDRLIDVLWPAGDPPRTARQSLHNHISRLRQRLGRETIVRAPTGYGLHPDCDVDLRRFDAALATLRSSDRSDPARDLALVDALLSLAGNVPVPELDQDLQAIALRESIARSVPELTDHRAELLIDLGQTNRALDELEQMTAQEPGRERRWELLVEALHQSGRTADALQAFHRARRALIESFGIQPGRGLQELHQRILQSTESPAATSDATPALDRDEEVRRIRGSLATGAVVQVAGPAGIGKTSLLAAIARHWDHGVVVRVDCADNPWAALTPVDDLLRRLAALSPGRGLPRRLADLRSRSDHETLGRWREPESVAVRAIAVIVDALEALDSPLLLVDDIDRAGPTTQEVMLTVGASPGVACVLTARLDPGPGTTLSRHETFRLGGLGAPALARLAARGGHPEHAEEAARWLQEHTGGHPLFATELLASVGAERPWSRGAVGTGPPLSRSLSALVNDRLAAVPASCRPLLDAAATLGDPVDLSLLRAVVDIDQLDVLVDRGILVRDQGSLRFAHSLFARGAYELVPTGRRQELHHAIGLRSYDPAVRAHHLGRAAHIDPEAAVSAAIAAGRAAAADQAFADASAWFERAADAAETHGWGEAEVLDLRLEARECDRLAGRPGHAQPLLDIAERAFELGHRALIRRSTISAARLGEAVDAGPLQARAAAIADRAIDKESDRGWRSRLLATASILHSISGEPDRCRAMFLEAMAGLDPSDDYAACEVLPYAYMALGHPDDLAWRQAATDRLVDAVERVGDLAAEWEAHHLRCSVAMTLGDGPTLRDAYARCERVVSRIGGAGRRWSNLYLAAAISAIDGRDDDAEALTQEVLTVGSGVAPARAVSAASGQLLGLRWSQGRLAELADPLDDLIAQQPEIPAWKAAASLVQAEHDPSRAAALFDAVVTERGVDLPRDFAWLAGAMCLGAAAVRLADPGRARRILPHLAPHAHLTCWQGTCTYGPVASVAADLAALIGDEREGAWRDTDAALRASLAAVGAGPPD